MKVVDVCEFYSEQGGGVRTYVQAKLKAAARLGHEMVILAPGKHDHEQQMYGGRILWIGGPTMPFDPRYHVLLRRKAVHEALDRELPDVVEGSSPWAGGWFAASWRGRAAKAFIFHQDPVAVYPQTLLGARLGERRVDSLFGWYWRYLQKLSAHFDATVVSGQWLAQRLERFGMQNPCAVPFGIERGLFSPQLRDERMRQDLLRRCGLPPSATLLIAVGRHHPEKRLPTLISAVQQLQAQREIGLVLYGDGPLRPWIERLAKKAGHVHVAGLSSSREQLAAAMASADALVHGSSAETYGLVVAEALACGLPLVVPSQGGAADLAGDSFAETYPPGNVEECAKAICRLLDRPQQPLREAAKGASAHVSTIDDHFDGLFELYGALCEDKPPSRQPLRAQP